ncbi:MAG: hypothetical protein DSY80_02635 [Desulfocapsa sp.]|nr:MAG: hypothetical protein DSY80_02635 [Desulfocapsa sp.]
MRIGINTLFMVPGDVGGTEVYLRNTLSAMAAQKTEHILVLFTNSENDSLLREDLAKFPLVEFHQLPCRASVRPVRIIVEQLILPFAAKKQNVDVLWSPGYTAPAFCFSPQAVTIHDLQYKSYPDDMSSVERKTLDILVRTACKRCQAVITVSEFSRQEVIKYDFAKGDMIFAVPNGVAKDFLCCVSGDVPANHSSYVLEEMGVKKPFFMCVAHTYPHKNVDKLIDAFCLLEDSCSLQLVLVGKARRGEDAVQKSLARVRDSKRVVRLNGLSNTEVQALYRNADVFVLPSSYEGFGLPVIEAMMAGTPVITPKMASLHEVGGDYTFYVDTPDSSLLAKQMLHVLTLPRKQKERHICNAQKWAEGFTWKRTALETMKIIESI